MIGQMQISLLYLKSNRSELSYYRPVSIVCKVMEGFVRDHLSKHFIANDLFSINQFGFLKGRPTMLQLLHVMAEWIKCLENGGQINGN